MAKKVTKTANGGTAPEAALDITKLTPAQIRGLQKQLKEKSKEFSGKKDERFALIDEKLKEKDADGNFKNTTRDIVVAMVDAKLVDTTDPDYDTREIKKIQARKQGLEKKTDKAGALVHPPGTFGYKKSEHMGFGPRPDSVVKFFDDPDSVAKLSGEQREKIIAALS